MWDTSEPVNPIEFKLLAMRRWGQPKLTKPSELKGVTPAFTVTYGQKRVKCQVFIVDGDVYVKHRDYFSPVMDLPLEDQGTPLGYRMQKYFGKTMSEKFVYADEWGDIVLRNEAWFVVKHLRAHARRFPPDVLNEILTSQERHHDMAANDLFSSDMSRMYESLIENLATMHTGDQG